MATFEYIEVPVGATRLRNSQARPAPKITTSLPHPSPPSSPRRRQSVSASPTMSLIPQLLLSASLPPMTASNPRKGMEPDRPILLSSKDPLSLPIMTTNFKRFITIVGPVFWLQDRIEEIVLWKTGWLRTSVWMAAYTLICFYPRVILLLPHLVVIGIILSTYPYPTNPTSDPLYSSENASSQAATPAEGSVPWQANIQGIQNLMGAAADLHALIEPYTHHLYLTPSHLSATRKQPSSPRSPYTPHILTLLTLSFPPLLFLIHLPHFPIRGICLLAGLAPFVVMHPYVRAVSPALVGAFVELSPVILERVKDRMLAMHVFGHALFSTSSSTTTTTAETETSTPPPPKPISTILQRILDDDRLSDACWNAEMREVELWENERYGGPGSVESPSSVSVSGVTGAVEGAPPPPVKGWSKQNLRYAERSAWTRGRDGWSAVGSAGAGSGSSVDAGADTSGAATTHGQDGLGEVSSNLTFSLAPGWSFIESEDWRTDVQCAWSGCGGGDIDGWVYTNDAWLGLRPAPYTSGGGSLTRRRRWVRRVWFDAQRALADS